LTGGCALCILPGVTPGRPSCPSSTNQCCWRVR
jgi:hypothetical protein